MTIRQPHARIYAAGPARVPPPHVGFTPFEISHVVFRSADPERLIDWYCKVLGAQVVVRTKVINFLTWDGSQDRIAIINDPTVDERPGKTAGFDHTALGVRTIRALVAQYRLLKQEGIVPYRCMNHGVATSMYYRDPDGNQIELSVEAFSSTDALNDWLGTGAFDMNPVGVLLDPEELAARVDAGESEDELRAPHPRHVELMPDSVRELMR